MADFQVNSDFPIIRNKYEDLLREKSVYEILERNGGYFPEVKNRYASEQEMGLYRTNYPTRQDYIKDYHGGVNEFYCGIGKNPAKKPLGTMQECAEAGKVNLYGKYKADPRILGNITSFKKEKKSIDKLKVRLTGLKGLKKRLEREIAATKNSKDRKKVEKRKEEVLKEAREISALLDEAANPKKKPKDLKKNLEKLAEKSMKNTKTDKSKLNKERKEKDAKKLKETKEQIKQENKKQDKKVDIHALMSKAAKEKVDLEEKHYAEDYKLREAARKEVAKETRRLKKNKLNKEQIKKATRKIQDAWDDKIDDLKKKYVKARNKIDDLNEKRTEAEKDTFHMYYKKFQYEAERDRPDYAKTQKQLQKDLEKDAAASDDD